METNNSTQNNGIFFLDYKVILSLTVYVYPRYILPSKGIKQTFNARQMVLLFSFPCHAERYFYLVALRILNPHNA